MHLRKLVAGWLMVASPFFVWAGHDDVKVNPAMKRYAGKVTELVKPYTFRAARMPDGSYPPDEMKGWRLTFLSGKRFASVFEVQANTDAQIVVTRLDGPLTDVAVNDFFVVEEIAVERPPK